MSAEVKPEQVVALIDKGVEALDKRPGRVPPAVERLARIGLEALRGNAGDIAAIGTDASVAALSWWSAADPFSDPPELTAASGRDAAVQGLKDATDALIGIEDRKRAALERLKRTALRVGLDVVAAAIPFLLRALAGR